MNAKELYTKQMTDLCEKNCNITAQDILAKAQARSGTVGNQDSHSAETDTNMNKSPDADNNIKPFKTGKRKALRYVNIAAAAVICFLLAGTSLLAATGHLGNILKNIVGDQKSTELAEKGYVYEVQKTLSDENFNVTLVGFTGDRNVPMVTFDISVNDPALVAKYNKMSIKVYTLGVEQFENELDHYMYNEAEGVKDDEIENLYHFSVEGAPVWLTYGEEAVIQICEITLKGNGNPWDIYDVNFEYRLTVPKDSFHPVPYIQFEDRGFAYEDVEYTLNAVQFGYYYTQVSLCSDTVAQNPPTTDMERTTASAHMDVNWLSIAPKATLIVDGTEYAILEEEGYSYVWMDTESEASRPYRCYMHLYFPDIDYGSAKDITLKIGGEEVIIK